MLVTGWRLESGVNTISSVLTRLLEVGITDFESDIRKAVLLCMDDRFDLYLGQMEHLHTLFVALNDENFKIRVLALRTIGRLSAVNPAYSQPNLRRFLLQLLTDLDLALPNRQREQSAVLLSHLLNTTPRFFNHTASLCSRALLPRLASPQLENSSSPLTVALLQCQSPDKREKAIWALGHVVSSSGFLVRPYERFPDLLNTLLTMMRTEHSKAIRRQVLRVIGCIGALDPFTLKIYLNEVDAVGDTQYILSLHEVEERSEVDLTQNELLVSVNWATFNEFYGRARSRLSSDIRRYMISQLAEMVNIVKLHIKPFMPQIVKLMHEFWSEEDSEILISLIELLVSCLYACGTCFREYLPRCAAEFAQRVKNTVLSDFFASDPALLRVTEIGGRLSSASTAAGFIIRQVGDGTSWSVAPLMPAGAAASSTANAAAVSAQQNQKLQSLVLQRSWQISSVVSKDDWHQWLRNLTETLIRESPSVSIRACRLLAQANPAIDNFKPVANFMDHRDSSPLPLSVKLLADKAIKTRVYAKALYYKETEFRDCVQSKFDPSNYSDILESLISINNKLGMVESAEGVLQNAASYF
uniref:Serine/threonine-protein kinase TOR n=1 Tax=Macrostomum lignano TaxID=282301 RepID=A0A1I8F4U6_9PLAT